MKLIMSRKTDSLVYRGEEVLATIHENNEGKYIFTRHLAGEGTVEREIDHLPPPGQGGWVKE